MLYTLKLMFRIPENIPTMIRVYRWMRGVKAPRRMALKYALGFWNWK